MNNHSHNSITIIKEMVACIPDDKINLIEDLNRVEQYALKYALNDDCEEIIILERIKQIIHKYIPKLQEDWEYKIVSIFVDMDVEEFKTTLENY